MSKFEKISFEQWKKDLGIDLLEATLREWYDEIKLPSQATRASAGLDFCMPYNLNFEAGSKYRIATGIRWKTGDSDSKQVLLIVPRSGLGFKYGIKLSNTIGVIDADYCNSDNEGHIIISIENPSDKDVELTQGKPFVQGIIVNYEIPEGAESRDERNGGFGSTDAR